MKLSIPTSNARHHVSFLFVFLSASSRSYLRCPWFSLFNPRNGKIRIKRTLFFIHLMTFFVFGDTFCMWDDAMAEISRDGFYESVTLILERFNFPNRDLSK